MTSRVTIQIVTWNSRKFLKDCLDSVFNQTFKNFSVLIIDNGSNDGTIEFIQERYLKEQNKQIFLFRNNKNLGFSQAHNQGFSLSQPDFILVMNPDIILEPDFLQEIIKTAEKKKRVGSFGGKILKIELGDVECDEKIKTKIIDSTGLKILKTRHIIDRGRGDEDKGQYDKSNNVFGISGACVLYRTQALEDVKMPIIRSGVVVSRKKKQSDWEYFDQDFFAYQEDMDLAWRLQLRKWSALYISEAKAYHFRSIGIKEKVNLLEIAKEHFHRPGTVECFSYRNHLWLLLKNSYVSNFLRHFFLIFFYQLGKEIYLLFTKPKVLFKASFMFWGKFRKMLRKRKLIMKRAKVEPKEIRMWMEKVPITRIYR